MIYGIKSISIAFLSFNILLKFSDGRINVGLITDQNDGLIERVFQQAIYEANAKSFGDVQLNELIEYVPYGNVFAGYKKLCGLMENTGISAIFGPSSRMTANHLINVCDIKEIPYIDTTFDFKDHRSIINLYPHPKQIAKALYDIIQAYEWKRFIFLYESGPYLTIFDEIMTLYGTEKPTITIRRYDYEENRSYHNILRGVKKSNENLILVVGSLETLENLLQQAQEVGLINENFDFIIGNLDLQTLDLQPYLNSDCNITGIRIVSPENMNVQKLLSELDITINPKENIPLTTNMALLYDAVQLFAKAVTQFDFSLSSIQINCTNKDTLKYGNTIRNYLAYNSINGLTGDVHFNFGLRTDVSFDIIELTAAGLTNIGTWNTSDRIHIKHDTPSIEYNIEPERHTLINKSFIVLTALSPPYGMRRTSADKLTGNDQYEGFGIELIQELASKLGFNYTFVLQEDNDYGTFNLSTNQSTGMVHKLITGQANLAITDLTITSERALGVDFTIPFMNLGVSILYKKAQKEPPKLLSFMDPFSKDVWIYLGAAYIIVSLSFFILGRLSPTEWDNPYPCIENPTELENQFNLSSSLWFTIGALLQQGSEIAPKAPSTRILGSIWWFFTIIMVASYTANLAAFLTVESTSNPINDVNDLAINKGGVTYGAKKGGATFNFFQSSGKYKEMFKYMEDHPELLPSSNEEGVKWVIDPTRNYAFLMESTSIEYNVERNCNLTQIGDLLDEKGYGIAMSKNFPYRNELNFALLELQEAGVLTRMKSKWWQEKATDGCSKKKKDPEKAEALGMPNLGGVYFVLLLGSILAALFGVIKWIFYTYRRAVYLKVPIKHELLEELKFVADCSKHTRIVKTTGSSYSRNSSITVESMKQDNLDEDTAKLT